VGVSHHADSTSIIVFARERSLRGPAIHFSKNQHEYHLSDVVGRCMIQLAGHQQYQTSHLQKNDVGNWFLLSCVNCKYIDGNFEYCWLHCTTGEQNVAMQVGLQQNFNYLPMSLCLRC
jgi:hypothetical protein